jgi:putative photosynthetic complex assembly protein 2
VTIVAVAVLVALTGWWFFTGIILWLVHLPKTRHMAVFYGAGVIFLGGLASVPAVSQSLSVSNAVLGFTLAIILWGWLEMGYLMGIIGGLHTKSCPPGASLGRRARDGLATCLYHEITVLATALVIYVLSIGDNPTILWTFLTLLLMRWSAKLNLILGVRNYNRDWLPCALTYVDSYVQRRTMNVLFPVSIVVSGWACFAMVDGALMSILVAEKVAFILIATLIFLGLIEHIFLMLPIGEGRLWSWAAPQISASNKNQERLCSQSE